MCIKINKVGKQEVGIWWFQNSSFFVTFFSATIDSRNLIFAHKLHIGTSYHGKRLWTNQIPISCLPTLLIFIHIDHICSFWRVQKRYPQYGIPIWRLWPNFRFLPSTVTEKYATKNILDRRTEVKHYTPSPICTFFVTFFSATIDGRNLIFGHKLHIGTSYRGKRLWTHQIPISCLPTLLIFIHIEHICSFFVAFWRVQKRFPQYGIPIWSLWPNIRFLSSIVA
jgi:phospholipid N-methyltransferase